MSEGQRAAVHAAAHEPVLILTGGPGSGKTLTTAHIVRLWRASGLRVAIAAPTGELPLARAAEWWCQLQSQ